MLSQYDSNVQRVPVDAGAGSWINQASLLAGFDQTYSRQHVFATAEVARFVYEKFSVYDYTHENLRAGWHMNLPDSANAEVDLTRTVDLARFADLNSTLRDVISTDRVHATVDFPVATYWRPVADVDAARTRNSSGFETEADLNTVQADAGIRYRTGSENQVDLVVRGLRGTYPESQPATPAQALVSSYRERAVDLRVKWKFSGASTLFGHVGYMQRRNDLSTFPNFGGPAYDMTYLWQPTVRTSVALLVLRQMGATGDNQYLSSVTHTYRLTPAYAVTEKIKIQPQFEYSHYDFLSLPNVPHLNFDVPNAALFVTWSPQRWLQVKLGQTWEHRTANLPIYDYLDRLSSLLLQATF